MRTSVRTIIPVLLVLVLAAPLAAQKVETKTASASSTTRRAACGEKPGGLARARPQDRDIDTADENLAFNYPADVASTGPEHLYPRRRQRPHPENSAPTGSTWPRSAARPGSRGIRLPDNIVFDRDGNLSWPTRPSPAST